MSVRPYVRPSVTPSQNVRNPDHTLGFQSQMSLLLNRRNPRRHHHRPRRRHRPRRYPRPVLAFHF